MLMDDTKPIAATDKNIFQSEEKKNYIPNLSITKLVWLQPFLA